MAFSSPSHAHSTLGCSILGKDCGKTIQYRGLKYADIPGRWQDSVLLEKLPTKNGVFDARRFGPSAPQQKRSWKWDLGLVGNVMLPAEESNGDGGVMDERECCNVVVTVPKVEVRSRRECRREGLPVLVMIHGGALSMGSNSWPQYDLEKLISHSVKIGKPVIGVSVNYRLGIFGFLASSEARITGNFGYKDQILALKWVKKHIAGFGGDPNHVTVMGESAGASNELTNTVSISTHLASSKEPLFTRAITMSGQATLRKPRPITWHNAMYMDQLKRLGLGQLSPMERVKALRSMPADEICAKLPLAQHFCGLIDGDFLRADITLSQLADGKNEMGKPEWCKELVVGDCLHDGTVLGTRILDDPNALSRLYTASARLLSPAARHTLLSTYTLRPTDSPAQKHNGLLSLSSDLRFYLPVLAVSSGWQARQKRVWRYHFHARNPVEGTYKGLACHELDLAFLLRNYNSVLPGAENVIAERMADAWIGFANGEGWKDEVTVFGGEGEGQGVFGCSGERYDEVFRGGRGKFLRGLGWDTCFRLAEGLQGVLTEKKKGRIRAKL